MVSKLLQFKLQMTRALVEFINVAELLKDILRLVLVAEHIHLDYDLLLSDRVLLLVLFFIIGVAFGEPHFFLLLLVTVCLGGAGCLIWALHTRGLVRSVCSVK